MRRASPEREAGVGPEGGKASARAVGLRTVPTMRRAPGQQGFDADHNLGSPFFPRDFEQLRNLLGSPLPPLNSPPLFQPSPRRVMLTSPARPANQRPSNTSRAVDGMDALASFFPQSPALSRPLFSPTAGGPHSLWSDTPTNRAMGAALNGEVFTPTPRKSGAINPFMALQLDGGGGGGMSGRQNASPEQEPPRPSSAPADPGAAELREAASGGSDSGSGGTAVPVNHAPPSSTAGMSCTDQLAAAALRGQAQKAARNILLGVDGGLPFGQNHPGQGLGVPGLNMGFHAGPDFGAFVSGPGSAGAGLMFGGGGVVPGSGSGSFYAGGASGGGMLCLSVKDMLLAPEEEGGLFPPMPSFGLDGSWGGLGRPRSRYLDFCATPRNADAGDDANGNDKGSGADGPADAGGGCGGSAGDGSEGPGGGGGYLTGVGTGGLQQQPLLASAPQLGSATVGCNGGDLEAPSPESVGVDGKLKMVSYPSSNEETQIAIAGGAKLKSGASRTTAETPGVDPVAAPGSGSPRAATGTECGVTSGRHHQNQNQQQHGQGHRIPGNVSELPAPSNAAAAHNGMYREYHTSINASAATANNNNNVNSTGTNHNMASAVAAGEVHLMEAELQHGGGGSAAAGEAGGVIGGNAGMEMDPRVGCASLPPPLPLTVMLPFSNNRAMGEVRLTVAVAAQMPRRDYPPGSDAAVAQDPPSDDKALVKRQIQQALQQQQMPQPQLLRNGSGVYLGRAAWGVHGPRDVGAERPGGGLPPRSGIVGPGGGGAAAAGLGAASTPSTLQRPQRTRTANSLYGGLGGAAAAANDGTTSTRRVPSMDFDVVVPEPNNSPDFGGPQHRGGMPSTRGRRTSESSAKSCRCKKSQCLKLYCDCFAAGQYCGACSCVSCHNRPEHADRVAQRREDIAARDPQAFTRKIQLAPNGNGKHKRGCNCRKSHCLKKYCECYQGGVRCGLQCTCMECENLDVGGPATAGAGGRKRGGAAAKAAGGRAGSGSRAGSRRSSANGMYDEYVPSPPMPSTSGHSEGPSPTPSQSTLQGGASLLPPAQQQQQLLQAGPSSAAAANHVAIGGGGSGGEVTAGMAPNGSGQSLPQEAGTALHFGGGEGQLRRSSSNCASLLPPPPPHQQQQQPLSQLQPLMVGLSEEARPLPSQLLQQQQRNSSALICDAGQPTSQPLQRQHQNPQSLGRQLGAVDAAGGGGGNSGRSSSPGVDIGRAGREQSDADAVTANAGEGAPQDAAGWPKRQRRHEGGGPPMQSSAALGQQQQPSPAGDAPDGFGTSAGINGRPSEGQAAGTVAAAKRAGNRLDAGGGGPCEQEMEDAASAAAAAANAGSDAAVAAGAMPPPQPPGSFHHSLALEERFTPRFTPRLLGMALDVVSPPPLSMLAHLDSGSESDDGGFGCRPRRRCEPSHRPSGGGSAAATGMAPQGGASAAAPSAVVPSSLRRNGARHHNGMVSLHMGPMYFDESSALADAMIAAIAGEASRAPAGGGFKGKGTDAAVMALGRSGHSHASGDGSGADGGGAAADGSGSLLCSELLGGSLLDDPAPDIFPLGFGPNSVEAARGGGDGCSMLLSPHFGLSHPSQAGGGGCSFGPSPHGAGAATLTALSPQRRVQPYGLGPAADVAAAVGPPLGLMCSNSWLQQSPLHRRTSRFAPTRNTCAGSGGGTAAAGMMSYEPSWPPASSNSPMGHHQGPELGGLGFGLHAPGSFGPMGGGMDAGAAGVHTLVSPVRTSVVPSLLKRRAVAAEVDGGGVAQQLGFGGCGGQHRENGWVPMPPHPSAAVTATSPSRQHRYMTAAGGGTLAVSLQPLAMNSDEPLPDPSMYPNNPNNPNNPNRHNHHHNHEHQQQQRYMPSGTGAGVAADADASGVAAAAPPPPRLHGGGSGRGQVAAGRGGRGGGGNRGGRGAANQADKELLKATALQYMTQRLGGGGGGSTRPQQQDGADLSGSGYPTLTPGAGSQATAPGGIIALGSSGPGIGTNAGGGGGGGGGGDAAMGAMPQGLPLNTPHQLTQQHEDGLLKQPTAAFADATFGGAPAPAAAASSGLYGQGGCGPSAHNSAAAAAGSGDGAGNGSADFGGSGGAPMAVHGLGAAPHNGPAKCQPGTFQPQSQPLHLPLPPVGAASGNGPSAASGSRMEVDAASGGGLQQMVAAPASGVAAAGATSIVAGSAGAGGGGGSIFVTSHGAAGTPGRRQLVRMGGMTKLGSGSTVFVSPNSAPQQQPAQHLPQLARLLQQPRGE